MADAAGPAPAAPPPAPPPALAINVPATEVGDKIFGVAAGTVALRNGARNEVAPIRLGGGLEAYKHYISMPGGNGAAAYGSADHVVAAISVSLILAERMPAYQAKFPGNRGTAYAVTMGMARQESLRTWEVAVADIEVSQTMAPVFGLAADGSLELLGNAGITADEFNAAAIRVTAFLEENEEYCNIVVKTAPSALPLNGKFLVETNHHFLDTMSRVVNGTVKRVANILRESDWNWMISIAEFRDAVFHASGHPVGSAVSVSIAFDPTTPGKLEAAALEPASIRLPPTSDVGARASSALAVFLATSTTLTEMNVRTGTLGDYLIKLEAEIKEAMVNAGADAEQRNAAMARFDTMLKKVEPDIAFLAGFHVGLCDDSNISEASEAGSLRRSYYLRRLQATIVGSYAGGMRQYTNGVKWSREMTRNGVLPGVGLFGAEKPADRMPSEDQRDLMRAKAGASRT